MKKKNAEAKALLLCCKKSKKLLFIQFNPLSTLVIFTEINTQKI